MGVEINKQSFSKNDYQLFQERLATDLQQLQETLNDPGFGVGERSIGAELECYILDSNNRPYPIIETLLSNNNDKQLTEEVNQYNLEYNLTPHVISASPFPKLEEEITRKLNQINNYAASHDARVVPIGILPTLQESDFTESTLTNRNRYKLLAKSLRDQRNAQFAIHIKGDETLSYQLDWITLEGANTSFQIHLRVHPDEFANTYNAVQLATPLAVAVAANSPFLLGKSLWEETRIPLFKQSLDIRHNPDDRWRLPARVNFGHGWLRDSIYELFAENVMLFPPLLPYVTEQEIAAGNSLPRLKELCLHHGTVWQWNRGIYDHHDNGHLRIEMRALPAGPTAVDMVANAAFLVGLAEGLKHRLAEILPAVPFHYAENNFYRAAQRGLDAAIIWPMPGDTFPRERPIREVIDQLLPVAEQGLAELGIEQAIINKSLGIIQQRLLKNTTAARWQKAMFRKLSEKYDRDSALNKMTASYTQHALTGTPVTEWDYEF